MQTVEFKSRIDGIPCRIIANISYYAKFEPRSVRLMILARKGYPSPWLESMLTQSDRDRLEEMAIQIDVDNRSEYA